MGSDYRNPADDTTGEVVDYNRLEHFRRHFLGPSGFQYLTVDDLLLVSAIAQSGTVTLNISIRYLAPDGGIQTAFYIMPVAANLATPVVLRIPGVEGFLLSASIAAPAVSHGNVFASLLLQRGVGSGDATLGQVLCQGMPDAFSTLGYPQQAPQTALDGRGKISLFALGNPGAGLDFSFAVSTGQTAILRSFSVLLTCSAGVANRFPTFAIETSGGVIMGQFPAVSVLTASQAMQLSWAPGANPLNVNNVQSMGFPNELRLTQGSIFRTITSGIQAGDQYSAPVIVAETFSSV